MLHLFFYIHDYSNIYIYVYPINVTRLLLLYRDYFYSYITYSILFLTFYSPRIDTSIAIDKLIKKILISLSYIKILFNGKNDYSKQNKILYLNIECSLHHFIKCVTILLLFIFISLKVIILFKYWFYFFMLKRIFVLDKLFTWYIDQ